MLYLIGLGLYDENDITQRALFLAKGCECYIELYTNKWAGSIERLSKLIGKPVTQLKRSDLEENLTKFLSKAKTDDIALFIPGDPLAATTHIDIVMQARKRNIPIQIVHNASIFSAIGETGLQLYKFGKTATIPFTGQLAAAKEAVKGNQKLGLHTLLLLDLDAEVGLYMSVSDALKMLIKAKIVKEKDRLVAASQLGSPDVQVKYGTVKDLMEAQIGKPAVLVVPGKLHFMEKEAIESF
jgi:diphthine synthase